MRKPFGNRDIKPLVDGVRCSPWKALEASMPEAGPGAERGNNWYRFHGPILGIERTFVKEHGVRLQPGRQTMKSLSQRCIDELHLIASPENSFLGSSGRESDAATDRWSELLRCRCLLRAADSRHATVAVANSSDGPPEPPEARVPHRFGAMLIATQTSGKLLPELVRSIAGACSGGASIPASDAAGR